MRTWNYKTSKTTIWTSLSSTRPRFHSCRKVDLDRFDKTKWCIVRRSGLAAPQVDEDIVNEIDESIVGYAAVMTGCTWQEATTVVSRYDLDTVKYLCTDTWVFWPSESPADNIGFLQPQKKTKYHIA